MLNIYKASAGSGKTFQLARKYIQLMLGMQDEISRKWILYPKIADEHRKILAVTFTNKATTEMKKRIVEELALLANESTRSSSDHLQYLIEVFDSNESAIGTQAKDALIALLSNFRHFNVSTIDSFFQTILRTFAHELDLNDNFELRLDDKDVIEEAVEDLLNTINGAGNLLEKKASKKEIERIIKWLTLYMDYNMGQGKAFNFFNPNGKVRENLINFIDQMLNEKYRENPDEIIEWCDDKDNLFAFEKECKEKYKELLENLYIQALQVEKELHYYKQLDNKVLSERSGIDKLLSIIISKNPNIPEPGKNIERAANGDISRILISKFTKNYPDSILEKEIIKFAKLLLETRNDIILYYELQRNIYPLGIFSEIIRRIQGYRKKEGAFLLSDTNDFLQKIIGDNDSPFIYERIGNRLHHFLLDEFQDTSHLQWKNLKPLLEESLATDNENLIIGDEKQCIYRFRNSDPELINSTVKEDLKKFEDHIIESGRIISQNTNWRSSSHIVKFNNSLFSILANLLNLEDYYSNVLQRAAKKESKIPGYVNLLLIPLAGRKSEDEENRDSKYIFKYDFIESQEYSLAQRIGLDRMASHMVRQLKSGYMPNQIAVLVRKKEEGEIVIRCLLELFKNIDLVKKPDVVSGDSLTLGESPAVNYIVSYLRRIVSPSSNEITDIIYKELDEKIRVKELFVNFQIGNLLNRDDNSEDASQALEDAIKIDLKQSIPYEELNSFNKYRTVTQRLPELCRYILYHYLINHRNAAEFIAKNENIYISTFFDRVEELQSSRDKNIVSVLKWWDEKGKNSTVHLAENKNAVIVITIHKSKGLEYDCVHIPFVNFDLNSSLKHKSFYWYNLNELPPLSSVSLPPAIPLPINKKLGELRPFASQYHRILDENKLDTLNILYVAFTRAARELIVTTSFEIIKSETQFKKVSDAIYLALQTEYPCPNIVSNSDNPDDERLKNLISLNKYFRDNQFEYGSPTKPLHEHKKRTDFIKTEIKSMPPLSINEYHNVEEITRPFNISSIDWKNPRERGMFLHRVLQEVNEWQDFEIALEKVAYEMFITGEQKWEAKEILQLAYDELQHKEWFNDFEYLLNETSVYKFADNNNIEEKRPDRVIIYNDGAIDIVDYKFAIPSPDHTKQVKKYLDFFRKANGGIVKGYLWYPLRKLVVDI